jgi:hypothetical protein
MLCTRHLLHVPRLLVLDHGIENRQELAHTGRQRDLRYFAGRAQALIKPFEDVVIPDRDQRTHVQGRPDMGATTPGRAGPPQGVTVPIEGSVADEGRDALAASGAQLWKVEDQRPRTHWPNAWDTAVQGLALAPDGARPQRGVQVVIQGRHALIEPGNMGLDVGPQATRRVFKAILFGGPHRNELPPPRQEGAQLFSLHVRKRTRRRSHSLCKVGHGPGIEDIGFGQLPSRLRKVPYLAGINHYEGHGGRRQCRDHGPVVATRGFEHNERGLCGLEPGDEGSNPRLIVRHRPAFIRGPQGDIKLRFDNIYTNKDLRGRHHHS